MMTAPPQCPDCATDADVIGPIPETDEFAGKVLVRPLPAGVLYRCRRCALGFRYPRLRKEELDALYMQGGDLVWSAPANSRQDWRIARGWLASILPARSRILDVGCFDGGFLEPLVGTHICYGIEIHRAARERAERKGVEVVGSDFSKVSGVYDCVTAFDVIEHVERPKAFLESCLGAVGSGGRALISTGNLDAFTFRLMGSRYRYCTIAEHISFVSLTWLSGLAGPLGYRILRWAPFAHRNGPLSLRTREAASNLLYRVAPSLFRTMRRRGAGGKKVDEHPVLADHPPPWTSARDHFIALLEKR